MSNIFLNTDHVPHFDIKTTILHNNNEQVARLDSLRIRLGESPNEVSFFVPFADGEETDNPLSFPIPFSNQSISNMIEIRFDGPNDYCSHFMCITSYNVVTRGPERGINYKAVDYLRGVFLAKNPIFKRYNNINFSDVFDPDQKNVDDYGIYYTNEYGSLTFLSIRESVDGQDITYSLMDAYHAIIDIFFTPKRNLGMNGPYPKLIFSDEETIDLLKSFKISQTQFMPGNQLNAIKSILGQVGSRFDIYSWGEDTGLDEQYLLITKKGNGISLNGHVVNSSDNTSLLYEIRDNHLTSFNDNEKLLILKDDTRVDTSNKVDAVVFFGGPREHLVYNAPLIPAWDWWNDYNIIVRKTKNNQVVPYKLDDGNINPEYPHWLVGYSARFENLAASFSQFDYDSESERLSIYELISTLWGDVVYKIANNYDSTSEKIDFTVNLVVFDALFLNPQDPMHKFRFKRYVAVRDIPSVIRYENGWDDPILGRYKKINNVLVDGKRHDIGEKYFSNLLTKTDTYKLTVPPILEGYRPDYFTNSKDKSLGDTEFELNWQFLDGVSIDSANGYFMVSNPKDVSVYFDKSKIKNYNNMQPINYRTFNILLATMTAQQRDELTRLREGFYKTVFMESNGNNLRGVNFKSEYIPFRVKMRSTFYYSSPEVHMELKDFDEISGYYKNNTGYLAGIYPLGTEVNSYTKLQVIADQNMIYQDYEDPSMVGNPEKKYLQSGALTNDQYQFGKVYVDLTWKNRNDYLRLLKKAQITYDESKNAEITGTLIVPEMLRSGSAKYVIGDTYDFGYGLGSIYHNGVYKPISDISHSFPNIQATISFDRRISTIKEPFDEKYIPKIVATEYFKNISDDNKSSTAPNQPKGVEMGVGQREETENVLYNQETGEVLNQQLPSVYKEPFEDAATTIAVDENVLLTVLKNSNIQNELGADIELTRLEADLPWVLSE